MILPIHPRPQSDELLSSWIVRLALANRYTLHTFYKHLVGYQGEIWNRDIDKMISPELALLLSTKTGISVEKIHFLSLHRYTGYLFNSIRIHGQSRWILPLGMYHRYHMRAGMQYCPLCLKEDATPYFRQHWRLALFTMCEKHHCLLYDHCPFCNACLMFHRNGVGSKRSVTEASIDNCFFCHRKLSSASATFLIEIPKEYEKAYLQVIYNFQKYKWHCGKHTPAISTLFYDGLFILISTLLGRYRKRSLKNILESFDIQINITEREEYAYVEVSNRCKILCVLSWLIQDWPTRFISFCKDAHLSKSLFTDYLDELPFWLAEVVGGELDNRHYRIPNEEITSAASYIIRRGNTVTQQSLRTTMGVSCDRGRFIWKRFCNLQS